MKKLLVILMGSMLFTSSFSRWEYKLGRAIGYGSKGSLIVDSEKIVLRANGGLAKAQMIKINGKRDSFWITKDGKKATMPFILNKKGYKSITKSLNLTGKTRIEFKDRWGTKKKFTIHRDGIIKSFIKAEIYEGND